MVLFIMLYKSGSVTFESLDEIQKCDYSNERCKAVNFPVVLFSTLCEVVLTFYCRLPIQMKATEQ